MLIMAINENIYGSKTAWDDNPAYSFLKMADFGENQNSLLNGVTLGKLSADSPIDKSIAFCGVGKECPLSNVQVLTNEGNNAVFESSIERSTTNWCLYTTTDRWVLYGDPNRISDEHSDWKDVTTDTDNINRYLKPITDFNIKNLVGVIYVRCYTLTELGGFTVSLKKYLDQYVNSHPLISEVYLFLYGGEISSIAGRDPLYSISGVYGGISISTLDSYPVDSDNLYRYASYKAASSFNYLPIYGSYVTSMYSDEKWLIYGNKELFEINRNGDYLSCYIHVTNADEFKELCLKGAAQYGLYFTDDNDVAKTGAFTDTNMYIGVLDENSISHGEYLKGTATATAVQNEWESIRDSTYDYTKDIDNTNYDNTTYFNYSLTSRAFTKMYVLTDEELSTLANELYTAVHQAPTGDEIERYNQSVFLTQNPIDCIISLKQFPLELPFSVSQNIKLGSYTCNTTGAPLLYPTGVYDFIFNRSINNTVYPVYGKSFLDYEPYTRCELSIPFCGTVEIPVSYIYDYDTIEVQLVIDYITGACTAYIISNGITIDSVQGNCAISLPVSGIQAATLDSQIHTAASERNKSALSSGLGLIGGLAAVAIGIGTGGVGAAVMGGIAALASGANMIYNDKKIEYDLQHMQLPLKQVGAASGAISLTYDMRCKMRITRPKLEPSYDSEIYANTVGFACLLNTTVGAINGFTVGDINLDSIDRTAEEKEMIRSAFATGVYL